VLISRTHSALDQLHYQYGSEQVEVLAGDMADFSLSKKAVDLALSRWGRLDAVVVNHGGLDPVKKVADSSPEEWKGAFDVNVFSAVGLVSLAIFLLFPHVIYERMCGLYHCVEDGMCAGTTFLRGSPYL
jgi:NADP-dependent 3-hydroxy acid dehydrogenase YdfG